MIIGPDVSFYQDDPETPQGVDFAKMHAQSKFVIIRTGQHLWIDPDFSTNWRTSKEAGLLRGSYWFYDSRSTPRDQAKLWFDAIGGDYPEIGLWMDFEEKYDGRYAGETNFKIFATETEKLFPTNVEIGIYTAYYYWMERIRDFEYWRKYRLWVANYDVSAPHVPRPWAANEWTFWQYTFRGDGNLYGVESSRIDLNYFNGDFDKLISVFRLGDTGEPMNGIYQMKTITQDTRLRPDHNTEQAGIGLIPAGVVLPSIDIFIAPVDRGTQKKGDIWLQTNYGGVLGWVAYIHSGYFICSEFKILALPEAVPLDKPDIRLSTPESNHYPASELVIHPK